MEIKDFILYSSTVVDTVVFIYYEESLDIRKLTHQDLIFIKDLSQLARQKGIHVDQVSINKDITWSGNIELFGELIKSLLDTLNLVQLRTKYVESTFNNAELIRYQNYQYKATKIKKDSDDNSFNNYIIEIIPYISQSLIEEEFSNVRKKRNELLQEVDYLEFLNLKYSDKVKLNAYKELLRDCINIVDYPHEVIFPCKPNFDIYKGYLKSKLSEDKIERIKDLKINSNNWSQFLNQWSKYRFNSDYRFIVNLATLYDVSEYIFSITSN